MEAMKVTRLKVAEAQALAVEDGILRYSRYLGAGYKDKYLDSFPLVDGRYAYYIEDPESGERYYQVFEDVPEEVMKELGDRDHKRKLLERYEVEHKDKASIVSFETG